jgi:radical SAM superfamily enzyme YgiQ (UPF0313 family)
MKVLLISANTEPINMPVVPVGLGAVAVATQEAGHEVKLLDLMNVRDPGLVARNVAETFTPDVIGISVRNVDDQQMENPTFLLDPVKEIMKHCRSVSAAPIVLGGAGYSIFPESALLYLGGDMGIQGEGEVAFPTLLSLLERGDDPSQVPGLFMPNQGSRRKKKLEPNLDLLMLPDIQPWSSLAEKDENLWMPVQTRRGCPMNCSYCSTSTIEGRIIRKRSPGMVADWIAACTRAGFKRFYFTDSIFNIPAWYARRLCSALAERAPDIAWRCIVYPGHINEGLVREMARAGCTEVALGFESGSKRILRLMHKGFGPEDIRRTAKIFAHYGIRRMGFLMLGGPGESRQSVEESLVFADSLQMDFMKITLGIRIYPGTALAERALIEGIITRDDNLLFPKFYRVKGLGAWLVETAEHWIAGRPHWVR